MKLVIDHIVVAAPDLDSGARHVSSLLGVEPARGGAHPRMGTHNRVLGMAGGMYLEVIAIDPDAAAPGGRAGSAWTSRPCANGCAAVRSWRTGRRASRCRTT